MLHRLSAWFKPWTLFKQFATRPPNQSGRWFLKLSFVAFFCCFPISWTTVYTFSNHVTYILGLVKITHFLGLLHIFTSQPNHPNPSHLQPAKPTKPHLGSASLPHFPNHGEAPTLAMATRVGTKHLPLGVFWCRAILEWKRWWKFLSKPENNEIQSFTWSEFKLVTVVHLVYWYEFWLWVQSLGCWRIEPVSKPTCCTGRSLVVVSLREMVINHYQSISRFQRCIWP